VHIQADPDGVSEQHISGTVLLFDSILTAVTFNASVQFLSTRKCVWLGQGVNIAYTQHGIW
jgi:hypothetical protein